jgi:hypothetical protein
MTFMIVGGFVFGVLFLTCWPSARLQRVFLAFLQQGMHWTAMAVVLGSAALFFRPDWAPEPLERWADLGARGLNDILPGLPRGAVWLLLAGLVVVVALPVLTFVDYARRLAGHSAMVQRLHAEIGSTARDIEAGLPSPDPDGPETAAANLRLPRSLKSAVKTMSAIAEGEPPPRTQRRPVSDFLR